MSALGPADAEALRDCIGGGELAVFPTDTVYGIGCDPDDEQDAERMYELKGRPVRRSSAVMFLTLERALETLRDLHDVEVRALRALLPGAVTVLLENRSLLFAAACRMDPSTIGLRVPRLAPELAALEAMGEPIMQTSANISGAADSRRLEQVPAALREGASLVLDGGELLGVPSTVLDLRELHGAGRWHVLREGACSTQVVQDALRGVV